jgi:hypothetical protein
MRRPGLGISVKFAISHRRLAIADLLARLDVSTPGCPIQTKSGAVFGEASSLPRLNAEY